MLRVGIIGCGGITERRHGPVLAKLADRVRVVALSDLSSERTSLIGRILGVPAEHQYTDYEKMLSKEELDLVHICTPHGLHEKQAVAAMQAGAHVFLEKPIATTIEEADRIVDAAEKHSRKMALCHNQIFSPASRAAKEWVEAGAVGKVFLVRTEGLGGSHVVGRGVDRDWRTSAAAGGGGPLIDSGYHQAYRAVDWVGSKAKRVHARVGRYVHKMEVEDMALLLIEHENGATTSLQVGWCAPGGAIGMDEIFGTEGQIRVLMGGRQNPVSIWQRSKGEWATPSVEPEGPDEWGFPVLVREFLTAIETDAPVPVEGEAARHTLSIVLAAYESGRTGRPVEISP
jgi:predicted dehydrogenase